MKLNKYHLIGLVVIVVICGALLYKMNIDVTNKNNVDPFSLGNAEGVQNLKDGGVEYYCKPVPKRPPHERDVEVGYYAHTNNKNTLYKQREHPSISTNKKESVHPGLMPVSDFEQTNYQIVNENDMHVRDSQGNNMTYEDMYKKAREQTNNSFSSMTNQEKCKQYCDNKSVKKWDEQTKSYKYEYSSPCTDECKLWGCANCDDEPNVATQEGFFSGFSKFLNGSLYEGNNNMGGSGDGSGDGGSGDGGSGDGGSGDGGSGDGSGDGGGNAVGCLKPSDLTGYDISGTNNSLNGFNITASCKSDTHTGTAVVTKCSQDGESYTLSGCSSYKDIIKKKIDDFPENDLETVYKNNGKKLIDASSELNMKLLHSNINMLNPIVIKKLVNSEKTEIDMQTILNIVKENSQREAANTNAPIFQSGSVEKDTPKKITIRFTNNLNPGTNLDVNDFKIALDGGTAKSPVGANILNNNMIVLTMNDAMVAGQTIVLDYTKNADTSKNISSHNGYKVLSFSNKRIANNIGGQQGSAANNSSVGSGSQLSNVELTDCEKKWTPTLINKYLGSNDSDKLKMSNDKGCMPPASALETAEVLKQASCVDEDQWNCVQVGQNGKINEERVDEKGVEGKLRGVPRGDEHLYMLKTKIVPPVCPKCPECPSSRCPVCENPKKKQQDDEVEDDMENNNINQYENNNLRNRGGLGFLAPPSSGSNQRQSNSNQQNNIQERGVNMRRNIRNNANIDFLQPRQNTNDIQRQMYNTAKQTSGAENIADNSYYTANAQQALPKGRFNLNLGAFGERVMGPLPRLTSFSAFNR